MKNWNTSTALMTVGLIFTAPSVLAEEINPNSLLDLSLAELSNIEVTSVSKKSEKESEAAAAIYVITQDDIKHSGMTNIPELLRMVPGLNVAQSGSHQWDISSRGLSGQFADTLLVLIDGRAVYTPLFSGVYWDVQDTPLQDIERIEVIRGPGATLWGANAVNGVINIITKNAKDSQGGYVSQSSGTLAKSLTNTRYGAKLGEDAYVRMYAKYDDYDDFRSMTGTGAHDAWNKAQSGFRADWKQGDQTYTLQGDIYQAGASALLNLLQADASLVSTNIREDNSGANILGRWDNRFSNDSNLTMQMYYDFAKRKNLLLDQNIQTFDLDMQHVWTPVSGHEVVWGSAYRRTKTDFTGNPNTGLGVPYIQILPKSQAQNLYSAFIQDKITLLTDEVFLTLGSKFEHNDFTGFEYQPSARLSWLINDKQTLWSSISRAVRTPNIGSTSDLRQVAAPTLLPGPTLAFLTQVGNPTGSSEELIAYELGYRIQPEKNISLDVSAFYNDYDRLIIGVPGSVPLAYGANIIVPIYPLNIGTAHTWGGETTAKWNPNAYTELAASYTLLRMKFDQADPLGYNFMGKTPQQQFNVRATFDLPHDLEFTASAYYMDRLSAIDFNTGLGVEAYTRLDLRLMWEPVENIELSLVGQNLLDDLHQEFSGFAYQNSSQVPRSVYGNLTWKF